MLDKKTKVPELSIIYSAFASSEVKEVKGVREVKGVKDMCFIAKDTTKRLLAITSLTSIHTKLQS